MTSQSVYTRNDLKKMFEIEEEKHRKDEEYKKAALDKRIKQFIIELKGEIVEAAIEGRRSMEVFLDDYSVQSHIEIKNGIVAIFPDMNVDIRFSQTRKKHIMLMDWDWDM
jgi:hypothetical protein